MNKKFDNRRTDKTIRLIASLIVLCFFRIPLLAQDTSADNRTSHYWARFGAGIAGLDGHFGFGGTIAVQSSSSIGLVGIRYLNSTKSGAEPTTIGETRLTGISEISATWGLTTNISLFHFSASTGVGIVWSTEKKSTGDDHYTRISLPLEGEVTFRPLPVLGLGGVLSVTLSPKNTVVNPMIVIHIGKLK